MQTPDCPKCGRQMAPGFVRAPHGILWRTASEKPLRWNWIWNALANTIGWWTFRENPAFHCESCKMLLIDHSRSLPAKKADQPG